MNSNLGIFFISIYLLFGEQIVEGIPVECEYVAGNSYYYCTMKPQNISGHEIVTHVNGNHEAGKTNENVKLIDFQRMKFDRMPEGLSEFFTNVEVIDLRDTGIKTLLKEDLDKFPKLKVLWAERNKLESLESNLFEGNPNMKWIYFRNNKLRSIGIYLFKPLTKLNEAWFERNPCINKNANSKNEIEELRTELIDKCPPTPEILQREVLLGQNEILKAINQLKAELAAEKSSCSASLESLSLQLSSCQTNLTEANAKLSRSDIN